MIMDVVFKLTERINRKQNIILIIGLSIVLILVVLRYGFNLISERRFSDFLIYTLFITLVPVAYLKKYKKIGSILIGLDGIIIKIQNKVDKINFSESKPDCIRFIYTGFKGDNSVWALFGIGFLGSFSGAFNRIEYSINGENKSFTFLLDNKYKYDSLKDLIENLKKNGINALIENRTS
jgi:hypothetical protein